MTNERSRHYKDPLYWTRGLIIGYWEFNEEDPLTLSYAFRQSDLLRKDDERPVFFVASCDQSVSPFHQLTIFPSCDNFSIMWNHLSIICDTIFPSCDTIFLSLWTNQMTLTQPQYPLLTQILPFHFLSKFIVISENWAYSLHQKSNLDDIITTECF